MGSRNCRRFLHSGFEKRLKQTEGHVSRLESIFEDYNEKPTGKKSKGMQGLIEEGDEAAKEDYEDATKDAVVIGASLGVEQYAHALIKTHWSHHRLGQISLGSFPGNYR